MTKKKTILIISTLTILVGSAIVYAYVRPDPQLAEVREFREQMRNSELPREEQRAQWAQYREMYNALPEEKQRILRDEDRERMEQRMEQRIDEFLALPAEERTERLDELIDRMEDMRQRWDQRRQQQASSGGGGGDGGQQAGRGRGQGRTGWDRVNPEARNERRLAMLNNTTPERRAKWTEFRRQMNDRRKERGLPEAGRGGWGGGRGRGR